MAQVKVTGNQLDIQDVASDIAADATAIGSIATGVTTDAGAIITLDADYLRRDGTTLMLGNLDLGTNNLVTTGTVDGRDVSVDGAAQDAHIADTTIHFTEASVDHTAILNIGVNTHAQIDTHIADATIHRVINDSGTTATELFSANEIISRLAGKSDVSHTHALGTLSDVNVSTAISGEALSYDGANWINSVVILTGSSVSTGGIDVFSAINGSNLEFNGVTAGIGGEISVTLDALNNNIVIDALPVTIAAGFTIGDISDITLTTPNVNSYLKYNGTTAWINSDFAVDVTAELANNSINALSDVDTVTSLPNLNEVLAWDGSNWIPTVNPIGVTDFLGLTDTPSTYVSDANQFVMVNTSETDLVFVPATLDNLFDVVLTGSPAPVVTNALVFDGTNWTHQVIDHINLSNIGVNSHAQIDTHIADATIHFTEASIDHTAILNIGVNSHAQIDTHIAGTALNHTAANITNVPAGTIAALDVQTALNELDTEKAPLISPALTGTPTTPTAVTTTNTTQIASTAFVQQEITANPAPVTDVFGRTGNVVAVAGDYTATEVTNVAAGGIVATNVQAAIDELDTEKAPLASPVFTGVPVLPPYTLVTLPTVVEGGIIFVTDANSGAGAMCYGQIFGSPNVWIDVTTGIAVV